MTKERRETRGQELTSLAPSGMGEVRINRRCNERCLFCNSRAGMDNLLETPEEVLAGIDALHAQGALGLTLTGMEPTLDPRLPDYVRHAKALGFVQVYVQSNGVRLADPALCRELYEAGLDVVTLSLHAANPAIAAQLTGYADDLADSLRAIDNLLALPLRVEVNLVLNRMNLGEAVPLVELLAARSNRPENEAARLEFYARQGELSQLFTEPERVREKIEARYGWPPPPSFAKDQPPLRLILSFIAPTFGNVVQRERLIPRYTDVVPELRAALDRAAALRLPTSLAARCSVPLCVMGASYRHVQSLEPLTGLKLPSTHQKYGFCNQCPLTAWCEGAWRGYIELHGVAEIIAGARQMKASKGK